MNSACELTEFPSWHKRRIYNQTLMCMSWNKEALLSTPTHPLPTVCLSPPSHLLWFPLTQKLHSFKLCIYEQDWRWASWSCWVMKQVEHYIILNSYKWLCHHRFVLTVLHRKVIFSWAHKVHSYRVKLQW